MKGYGNRNCGRNKGLHENVNTINEQLKINMRINTTKTKTMVIAIGSTGRQQNMTSHGE